MSNKPVESVTWDWLAEIDRRIARRQKERPLAADFSTGVRFTIRVQQPTTKAWVDHGPCRVQRLTATSLLYYHLGYDQPLPLRQKPRQKPRRLSRMALRTAMRARRVTFH